MSKKICKYLWIFPVTLCGTIVVLFGVTFNWIERFKIAGPFVVFVPTKRCPRVLYKRLYRSIVIGQVVLIHHNDVFNRTPIYRHALVKLEQSFAFGTLYPFIRLFVRLLLKCLTHAHVFYDDPFEIDARRGAGQFVDIPRLLAQLNRYHNCEKKKSDQSCDV